VPVLRTLDIEPDHAVGRVVRAKHLNHRTYLTSGVTALGAG
jgi:hypothetical protein